MLGAKESSSGQARSSSVYLVKSLVTMRPPAALTWNFLKWSRSRVRRPRASSVRKEVRLAPSRTKVVRSWVRVRKVWIERQVCES